MKIVTALSGGVDSGTTAYLLQKDGCEVVGLTFEMIPGQTEASDGARSICRAIGAEHHSVDMTGDFRHDVIEPFIAEYLAGKTPNPCVFCNRKIKFPKMFDFADSLGIEECATGHYARIGKVGDSFTLKKASDDAKDQSYVLWNLTQDQLGRLRFPLGELTKDEVREIARQSGLPCASAKDSMDICFIPDGDYAGYIERSGVPFPGEGDYVDTDGKVLGKHRGHHRATPGQSRGLGIALGQRMYVLGKNAESNTVTLGSDADLYRSRVIADRVNLLCGSIGRERLSAKVRYGRRENTGYAEMIGEDMIAFDFDDPVRAPAPGQSLVIYDGDTVVAGGIICG